MRNINPTFERENYLSSYTNPNGKRSFAHKGFDRERFIFFDNQSEEIKKVNEYVLSTSKSLRNLGSKILLYDKFTSRVNKDISYDCSKSEYYDSEVYIPQKFYTFLDERQIENEIASKTIHIKMPNQTIEVISTSPWIEEYKDFDEKGKILLKENLRHKFEINSFSSNGQKNSFPLLICGYPLEINSIKVESTKPFLNMEDLILNYPYNKEDNLCDWNIQLVYKNSLKYLNNSFPNLNALISWNLEHNQYTFHQMVELGCSNDENNYQSIFAINESIKEKAKGRSQKRNYEPLFKDLERFFTLFATNALGTASKQISNRLV